MMNSMWGQCENQKQRKTSALLMPHDIAHHSMSKESPSVSYTGVEGSHMVCTKKGKNGEFTVKSSIASKKSHTSEASCLFYSLPTYAYIKRIATTNVEERLMGQS